MTKRAFGRETKFQKARTELEALANRLGPDEKLPPVRELADSLGVSLNTLTGALDELEIQNIVYRRHGVGVFVSSRPRTIWLICNPHYFARNQSPFWDVLIEEARLRASKGNEKLSMHFSLPQGTMDLVLHQALAEEFRAGRVQGVISIGLDQPTVEWIEEQGVPCTAYAGWAPHMVAQNYEMLVQLGVKALVDRGCRRLSLWKPTVPPRDGLPSTCVISEVFQETVRSYGLELDPALLKNNWHLLRAPRIEPTTEQGYRTAFEVFDADLEWPDGILCTEDTMTHGALLAMAKLDIKPGRDVMFVSHSNRNTSVLLGSEDDIMRLEFDPVDLVQNLFEMLESLMSGRVPERLMRKSYNTSIRVIEPRLCLPTGK